MLARTMLAMKRVDAEAFVSVRGVLLSDCGK